MFEKSPEFYKVGAFQLAEIHPERLQPLLDHIADSISSKMQMFEKQGKKINIHGPDWCYAKPMEAGRMHADIIVQAYGPTYALPNKNPEANTKALQANALDMYLMEVDGKVTGTTCLIDMGNGIAELGRSASLGRTGNSIIQDLRIFDWLTDKNSASKFHTLFTTLRNAPDRSVSVEADEDFIMRGGQAVTAHWKKFPTLKVNGFAPLYLKSGMLEQFSYATLTRGEYDSTSPIYLDDGKNAIIASKWHAQYGIEQPELRQDEASITTQHAFSVEYPPIESGLTDLVHADIHLSREQTGKSLLETIKEANTAGSPFIQVLLDINSNTIKEQRELRSEGFKAFGYIPATAESPAQLMLGRVRMGVKVVPSAWTSSGQDNPFWPDADLQRFAESTEKDW